MHMLAGQKLADFGLEVTARCLLCESNSKRKVMWPSPYKSIHKGGEH